MPKLRRSAWAPLVLAIVVLGRIALWAPPAAAVTIQRVEADGIEAWLVEDHANPIIAVQFAFRGGAALDPQGKAGLAEMVSGLLDEGAGDLDSQAYQGRLEDLSIHLGFNAGLDTFTGSLQTLSERRAAAFEMLKLALTRPRFDAEAVERIRSQLQAQLRDAQEDPDDVASRTLWAKLFPDHPYGRPVEGTAESIAAISVDDLRQFVAGRLVRDRLVVGVVGDITPDQLKPLLTEAFGALPAAAAPGAVVDVAPQAHGQVDVVTMDVPQSAIVFAQAGLKRDDPRFYALTVLNQLLGGQGLSSRLFEEVREKRGLVYSVYSTPVPLDHAALMLGGAGTANAKAGQTIDVIRSVWRRLAEGGATDGEVADAKTFLTGSFPLRFTGSGRLAGLLVSVQLEHLGIDYLDRRASLIEQVTTADVNTLAKTLLAPDSLTFVVVGQPQGVASGR